MPTTDHLDQFPASPQFGDARVPPFPGPDIVKPYNTPPVPPLHMGAPHDTARQLLAAYRSAVERVTGKPCLKYARGGLNPRATMLLHTAAKKLEEHRLRPHVWASFRLLWWEEHHGTGKLPTPEQVFQPNLIDAQRGMCRGEASSHGAVVSRPVPAHAALIEHWDTMKWEITHAIMDNPTTTTADVEQIVARYWEPGAWDRWLQKIETENQQRWAEDTARIRLARWIWGR